jgi:putative addiction module antidote
MVRQAMEIPCKPVSAFDVITYVILTLKDAPMATATKIIAIGNSVGVILPKETMARLNVQKGDTLYITQDTQGIRLVPYDEEFARQMEAAREVMRENRDVLQRLAE